METCSQFHAAIQYTFDGNIPPEERARLDEHLHACAECRKYADRMHLVDRRLNHLIPLLVPNQQLEVYGDDITERLNKQAVFRKVTGFIAGLILLICIGALASWLAPKYLTPPRIIRTLPTTTELPPALQPSGALVFEARQDGNAEIFFSRPDGSEIVNLTNHRGWDGLPSPSPDGRALAFVSDRSGFAEIYIYDLSSNSLRQLTQTDQNGAGWVELSWSPDGRWIAAVQVNSITTAAFHIQRGDPTNDTQDFDGYLEGALYVIETGSGETTLVSRLTQLTWNPQWALDSSQVYFNAVENGYSRIYSTRTDGSDLSLVGDPDGTIEQGAYSISGDGRHIAYFSLRRSRGNNRLDQILMVDTKGSGTPRVLAEFSNHDLALNHAIRMGFLAWGPVDDRLAYVLPSDSSPYNLRMIEISTGNDTLLFSGLDLTLPQQRPAWSPDGLVIALVSDRKVFTVSALIDMPGGQSIPMTKVFEDYLGYSPGSLGWLRGSVETPAGLQAEPTETRYQLPVRSTPPTLLVFEAAPTGDSEIFKWSSTYGIANLSHLSSQDISPMWSSDGENISFLSDRSGNVEIFQTDINGFEVTQLSQTPSNIVWKEISDRSPDNQRLLLVAGSHDDDVERSIVSNKAGRLFIFQVDGTRVEQSANEITTVSNPAWGPYGNSLVYQTVLSEIPALVLDWSNPEVIEPAEQGWQIDGYDLSTDRQTVALTTSNHLLDRTTWRIEVRSLFDSTSMASVIFETETGNLRLSNPSWSPDGRWLAFFESSEVGVTLYRVHAAGGVPVALWQSPSSNVPNYIIGTVEPPAWSPDGEWIAVSVFGSIYLVRASEGAESLQRALTIYRGPSNLAMWPRHLSWQPIQLAFHQPTTVTTAPNVRTVYEPPVCAVPVSYYNLDQIIECRNVARGVILFTTYDVNSVLAYYREELENTGWQIGIFEPVAASPRATWHRNGFLLSVFVYSDNSPYLPAPLPPGAITRVEVKIEPY